MLSPSELASFRTALLALANRAEDVRADLETETVPIAGDDAGLEAFRPAEVHSRAAEEVVTNQLLGLEAGVEREALAAVVRMYLGAFGAFVKCTRPIRKARLEAIPYARLCVPCASAL